MFALRKADNEDLDNVVRIISASMDGLAEYLLGGKLSALVAGKIWQSMLAQGMGAYCLDNMLLALNQEEIVGLLFAYPGLEQKVPDLMETFVNKDKLNAIRPVIEAALPDTLYINCLWTKETGMDGELRAALLGMAEKWATARQLKGISVFVWADLTDEVDFFLAAGFEEQERIPAVSPPVRGEKGPHDQGGVLLARYS